MLMRRFSAASIPDHREGWIRLQIREQNCLIRQDDAKQTYNIDFHKNLIFCMFGFLDLSLTITLPVVSHESISELLAMTPRICIYRVVLCDPNFCGFELSSAALVQQKYNLSLNYGIMPKRTNEKACSDY